MNVKILFGVAVVLAAMTINVPAHAGAKDYVFEPVAAELKPGDDVAFAVRLVHKPSGKPVAGATIIRTRVDMAPEGMAEHAAPATAVPGGAPGTYGFKADLSMAGRWQLSIAAKVQGEPETVLGKVVFKVTK
jgi:hypothetical protein